MFGISLDCSILLFICLIVVPDGGSAVLQSKQLTDSKSSELESRDYCLHESFNATCRPGTVILMTSAVYGRMRLGRCISGDFNIGCFKDIISYFDRRCTGRRTCDVVLRNLVDVHPCQRDFMSYLEASYRCIPAYEVTDCLPHRSRLPVTVNETTGEGHVVFDPSAFERVRTLPVRRSTSNFSLKSSRPSTVVSRDSIHSGGNSNAETRRARNQHGGRLQRGSMVGPDKADGNISSGSTATAGTEFCPWIISAKPGQRLRLKVMVLGPVSDHDDDDDNDETSDGHPHSADDLILPVDADSDVIDETSTEAFGNVICSAIFVVGETMPTANGRRRDSSEQAVCQSGPDGGGALSRSRVRHLYTSIGHQVSLYMTDGLLPDEEEMDGDVINLASVDGVAGHQLPLQITRRVPVYPRLIISYEALGCPDLVAPPNAWLERTGDRAMVKCNDTLETWFLTCQGNRWIGDVTNCSTPTARNIFLRSFDSETSSDEREVESPYSIHGVVLAVLLGIILGVCIGMLLLLTLFCVRRKRSVVQRRGFNRAILLMSGTSSSAVDHQVSSLTGSSRLMATPSSCSTVEWSCRVPDIETVGSHQSQKFDHDACSSSHYQDQRSSDYLENQQLQRTRNGVRSFSPVEATFYRCSHTTMTCDSRYDINDSVDFVNGSLSIDDVISRSRHHKEVKKLSSPTGTGLTGSFGSHVNARQQPTAVFYPPVVAPLSTATASLTSRTVSFGTGCEQNNSELKSNVGDNLTAHSEQYDGRSTICHHKSTTSALGVC